MAGAVVTGRGVVSPLGEGADHIFSELIGGANGIVNGSAPCTDFDSEKWMTPRDARRSDRFTHFSVAAGEGAAEEAGLKEALANGFDPARVGVVMGTGIGGLQTLEEQTRSFLERGERGVSPHMVPMMMPNAGAAALAMRLGLNGPGWTIASACATGSHAIGEAVRMIENGDADIMLAGGAEAPMTPLAIAAFKRMGALSKTGISRPFDADRDGFVISEGAAVLVLESEESAKARGAKIYGRVAGYGATNDAHHVTMPDPEGRGATASMTIALRKAGLVPSDIGYINAHGTSTQPNDRIETLAIKNVFGANTAPPISSTKSATGHLLGAAGAIEAIFALGAIQNGVAPATINYVTPDPNCDLDIIPNTPREIPGLKAVVSNSFGFGGQNASLVLTAE